MAPSAALGSLLEYRFVAAAALVLVCSRARPRAAPARLLVAAGVLVLAFGRANTAWALAAVAANAVLLQLRVLGPYVFVVLNLAGLYAYKLAGRAVEPRIGGTFDISGFLMVLTVKASYAARDLPALRRQPRRGHLPVLVLEYLLFLPGLLSGPTPTLDEFTACDRAAPAPLPTDGLLRTAAFLALFGLGRLLPARAGIFAADAPWPRRLLWLYVFNVVQRAKFHFIWNLADCAFRMHGFRDLLNIDFRRVEATESVREISAHWNRFVSRWLKAFFFRPLLPRSTALAVVVTHLASACLHGLNPCYLLFFFSFGLYSGCVTRANRLLPWRVLRVLQMVAFVSYFSMPFYLLSLREAWALWRAVGFFGHAYFTALALVFAAVDALRALARRRGKPRAAAPRVPFSTSAPATPAPVSRGDALDDTGVVTPA